MTKFMKKLHKYYFWVIFAHFRAFSPKLEFSQIWDISCKNNSNMFFPFRPLPEENKDKICEKIAKIPFLGHFCPFSGHFGTIFGHFPQN